MPRNCQCGRPSKVYAMDPIPDGWADYYCSLCVNPQWIIETLYCEEN